LIGQWWAGWRAIVLVLLLIVMLPAAAHKRNHPLIRLTLEPLPSALHGIDVQLYDAIAPQVLLANQTPAVVEVLDVHGNAFLRIGAGRVLANPVSPTWYDSYFPDGIAAQPGLDILGAALPATWKTVASANSWGWYDPRLDASQFVIPSPEDRMPRALGQWQIPLRINGQLTHLSGEFRYDPPPAGVLHTEIVAGAQHVTGLRFTIVQGRYPALFVASQAPKPVVLLDTNQLPFLSIGPEGVYANPQSVGWRHSGRAAAYAMPQTVSAPTPPGCVAGPAAHWLKVTNATRYSYIEPRLHQPNGRPTATVVAAGKQAVLNEWEIPYCYAGARKRLLGFNWWQPAYSNSRKSATNKGATKP